MEDYVDVDIPQIKVENSRIALADLSNRYFNSPSEKLNMVGITATNGKDYYIFYVGYYIQVSWL